MSNIQPDYYKNNDTQLDVIDIVYLYDLPFTLGNVLKYIVRAGDKNPETELEDLEKALEYLNRHIQYIKEKNQKF